MENGRTSEESKNLYQSLRNGDKAEVEKAYKEATTSGTGARSKVIIPTRHNDTILHMAIYMGKQSIAIGIIEICGYNDRLLKISNKFGNTALHEAAATDCVRVVEKLLEKAPDLLSKKNNKGEMPLYTAALFGQTTNFDLLAKKLNEDDLRKHLCSRNSTVLHAAIHAEFYELALLIATNKEYEKYIVHEKDKHSMTPLQLLSSNSSAFESGMKCGLIKRLIYYCAPYDQIKVKEEVTLEQNSSYDSDVEGFSISTAFPRPVFITDAYRKIRNVLTAINRSIWIVLRAWGTMRNIYHEKNKRHGRALELAKFLIAADFSWDVLRKDVNESASQAAGGAVPLISREPLDEEVTEPFSLDEEVTEPSLEKSTPGIPLHIATENGIVEIVDEILRVHTASLEYRNTKDQNILHLSIMHRQRDIFNRVTKMKIPNSRLIRQLDHHKFTILHHVGNTDYYTGGTQPGPALQLQEELEWYEKVEELIPLHYAEFRACEKDKETTLEYFHNKYVEILKDLSDEHIDVDKIVPDSPKDDRKEETPREYFRRTHNSLLENAQEWLKRTAESCSTVAGLMATVAFAAAFTVPGGNDENSGTPLLLHSPFFLVFIITDALSLASSLTSLVMFLSILTSPFELHDFRYSLPRKLILGFTFLFFSVAVTMLAFASTLMLTIPMKKRLTKSFVYCVAFLPVAMFALLQFPLYLAFRKSLKSSFTAMKSVWISTCRSKTAKIH